MPSIAFLAVPLIGDAGRESASADLARPAVPGSVTVPTVDVAPTDPESPPAGAASLEHRVLITYNSREDYLAVGTHAAAQVTPYFPDGCPETAPPGWPTDTPYERPHLETICPACIQSWRSDFFVSDPVHVPDGVPLLLEFPWSAEIADARR